MYFFVSCVYLCRCVFFYVGLQQFVMVVFFYVGLYSFMMVVVVCSSKYIYNQCFWLFVLNCHALLYIGRFMSWIIQMAKLELVNLKSCVRSLHRVFNFRPICRIVTYANQFIFNLYIYAPFISCVSGQRMCVFKYCYPS